MKIILLMLLSIFSLSYANESYYENGKLVELHNIYSSSDANDSSIKYYKKDFNTSPIKYYKTVTGKKVGVTDQLLVQCIESVNCPELLDTFNLSNYSKLSNTIFIVKIKNGDNIFSVSKALFESKEVEFAHPNFIKEKRKR